MNRTYALLLEAKYALDFSRTKFSWSLQEKINTFFRSLLQKGQRQVLKDVISVCKANLTEPKYAAIRGYIFGDVGQLSLSQVRPDLT